MQMPCMHVFCAGCIIRAWYRFYRQRKNKTVGEALSRRFPCPECRTEILQIPPLAIRGLGEVPFSWALIVDKIIDWALSQGKEKMKEVDQWFVERGKVDEESKARAQWREDGDVPQWYTQGHG